MRDTRNPFSAVRSRRWLVEGGCVALVVLIAGLLFAVRYQDPRRVASGDSFWYMRQALIFTGVDHTSATTEAARLMCRDMNRSLRAERQKTTCTAYPTGAIKPRYREIFASRPGFPLFGAPFVAVLGVWDGMVAATLVLALLAAALAYLAVWMATGRRRAGLLAAAMLFVLPSGFAMTRMLVESGVIAGYLAVLIGAMLILRGRVRPGVPIIVVALLWLFAVRSASGMAMSLVLIAGGPAALVARGGRRNPALLAGLGGLAVVAWTVVSVVLKLPGFNETVQDLATVHYTLPDVPHPVSWLLERNRHFWPDHVRAELVKPYKIALAVFVLLVFWRRMRPVAVLWIATGLTGVLMVLVHPLNSEYDRLIVPFWIPVAAVLGLASALALDRLPRAVLPKQRVPAEAERTKIPAWPTL
ncbi:hypothetical protein [Actinoplanes sp. HUAS TT8]|uniref:hypothetical protein n=1 Tax=Actinoplanes sp. HUAS TT8 TaxID=3447453 RepID=UPI003F52799B